MDDLKDLLDSVELSAPWTEKLNKACPACGEEMTVTPGSTSPNVAKVRCEVCGFMGMWYAPREDVDQRWNDPVVLD